MKDLSKHITESFQINENKVVYDTIEKKLAKWKEAPLDEDDKKNITDFHNFVTKEFKGVRKPELDGFNGISWYINAYKQVLKDADGRIIIGYSNKVKQFWVSTAGYGNKNTHKGNLSLKDAQSTVIEFANNIGRI